MKTPFKILIAVVIIAIIVEGAAYLKRLPSENTALPRLTVAANPTTAPASPLAASVNPTSSSKEFHITAHQFAFEPSTIRVKQGDAVRLYLTSADVGHGISIPDFGVNLQGPVGQEVSVDFIADRTGTFRFFCNVFCGSGHRDMTGTLIVE